MFTNTIQIRLFTITTGVVFLILGVELNAAVWVIINAVISLSIFLFISVPYYLLVIKNTKKKYTFNISLNYLLFLTFLFLIGHNLFFITFLHLAVSLALNFYLINKGAECLNIDDRYSPVHFAVKNYKSMNYALNIIIIGSLLLSFYLFTPLFNVF